MPSMSDLGNHTLVSEYRASRFDDLSESNLMAQTQSTRSSAFHRVWKLFGYRSCSTPACKPQRMEVADYEDLRDRFEAERIAIDRLEELGKAYRAHVIGMMESSTELTYQLGLFYGPENPKRRLVERLTEVHMELNSAVSDLLNSSVSSSVLGGQSGELVGEYEKAHRTMMSRDDALNNVEKLQKKHEETTSRNTKDDRIMYTGEKLKEAINSYALLQERTANQVNSCHETLSESIDPALKNLILFEEKLFQTSSKKLQHLAVESKELLHDKSEEANDSDRESNDTLQSEDDPRFGMKTRQHLRTERSVGEEEELGVFKSGISIMTEGDSALLSRDALLSDGNLDNNCSQSEDQDQGSSINTGLGDDEGASVEESTTQSGKVDGHFDDVSNDLRDRGRSEKMSTVEF